MKSVLNKILDRNIRYKLALVIALVGLLSIVSGGSYAILRGNITSENEQVIEIGKVKLLLTENFDNISGSASMFSDVEGLLIDDTYDFNIKNIGNAPAKIDVKLNNVLPSGSTATLLDDEYIMIGLEVNGEEMGPMNLEDVNSIIDSNIINKNEIINYKLRIWLDKNKKSELESLTDSQMFLKLSVDAEQRVKEKNRLPSSYQEVEYIESTGTQYIDTGINFEDNNFNIDVKFVKNETSTSEQAIFSIWTSNYNYWNFFIRNTNNLDVYTSNHHELSYTIQKDQIYNSKVSREDNHWELKVNDNAIDWDYTPSTINNTTLKIFTRGDVPNSTYSDTHISLYSMYIYINDKLSYSFIPCYRKSDGKVGLFDIINKKFYTNAGTGEFLKGDNVNS